MGRAWVSPRLGPAPSYLLLLHRALEGKGKRSVGTDMWDGTPQLGLGAPCDKLLQVLRVP